MGPIILPEKTTDKIMQNFPEECVVSPIRKYALSPSQEYTIFPNQNGDSMVESDPIYWGDQVNLEFWGCLPE